MSPETKPFIYQIRIEGHLDERWLRRFEGLDVAPLPEGETLISGEMDQSALYHFQMMNPAFLDAQPKGTLMFLIAVGTAKWHVHNILQKLDVGNRPQTIARAHELGRA